MQPRKFRVWKSPYSSWMWECSLCDPHTRGGGHSWAAVMTALRRHMLSKRSHHEQVQLKDLDELKAWLRSVDPCLHWLHRAR